MCNKILTQNGMFAEHWDELNLVQMFQQIGARPPLGGLASPGMTLLSHLAALLAIVSTGIVAFRPAAGPRLFV